MNVWKRRAASRFSAPRASLRLALLCASPLLPGCHPQHATLADGPVKPQAAYTVASANGLPVQQSPVYKAAVDQYQSHDYPAALAGIDGLLRQAQYRQRPADYAFLLHQQAICRHAIDPRVAASVPAPAPPAAPRPALRLASDADCGPRALLLLCPQFGVRTTLDALRQKAGTTARGTTMSGLAAAAKSVGLKAQGVQVDRQALEQVSDPAIAWVDGNHYVALLSVSDRQATIHDPNKSEEEVVSTNELLGRSGGFLMTLSR